MTTENLTKALYDKMDNELKQFTNWLLTQTPQVILDHACEYATKCNILSIFEEFHLSPEAAQSLLNLDKPMDTVWQEYGYSSSNSMDVLVAFVIDKAEELTSASQANVTIPPLVDSKKSTLDKLKTPSISGSSNNSRSKKGVAR